MPRMDASQSKWYSIFTHNFGTKLISIGIAFVLWLIVYGSRNVEDTKEIPVEIITPADLVVSNEVPDRISFRLSGPKAFLRTVLDRKEEPIRINLSGSKPGAVTYRFFSDNIRVPIGVKILGISPPAILIKVEEMKTKEVPLQAEFQGSLPEGFKLVKTTLAPELVKIKGPASRIDNIAGVTSLPMDLSHVHQTLTREVPLDLKRMGVSLVGAAPQVQIQVEATAANFRLKNVEVIVRSNLNARLEEKSVTVLVRAEPQDLEKLSHVQLKAYVDLRGKAPGKYSEHVKIELPEEMGLVKIVPEKVNVTLY